MQCCSQKPLPDKHSLMSADETDLYAVYSTLDMKLLRETLKYTLGDNGRCHPTLTGRGFWPSTRHPVLTKTNIFFRLSNLDLEESKQVFK